MLSYWCIGILILIGIVLIGIGIDVLCLSFPSVWRDKQSSIDSSIKRDSSIDEKR